MDKASYSLSAIAQCKELIRKAHWSTRLKAEHKSRCAEVNTLFASCQTLLNCILFQPDLSLPMIISKWFFRRTVRRFSSIISFVFAVRLPRLRFLSLKKIFVMAR